MRVQAWLADVVSERKPADAQKLLAQVVETYPTVLRQLDITLPVTLSFAGPLGEAVADRIQDSPRFSFDKMSSFKIEISTQSEGVSICLVGAKQYGCIEQNTRHLDEDADLISTAIDAFHDKAFSPRLELTQSDVSSLDGSTVRQDARSALDSLLGKERER
tara:strand:- start:51 stop:533 length:483 start_codon:yes stop_codon:yes gene_type:complete